MSDGGRSGPRRRLRRGAPLLPNLFTIGNLVLGSWAVVEGLEGNFPRAAVLIFVAAVLDTLDGRIARLTGTDSAFGREFDSLADVVTFGAAPALLAYVWGLEQFGRIGWLVPAYFLVCCASRLARFNVQTKPSDNRFFAGLPAPAAGAAVGSLLLFAPDSSAAPWSAPVLLASMVALGTLMVSTFRYWSFKRIDLRRRWSYRIAVPLAAVLLIVAIHPPAFFLLAAILYTASAPISWSVSRLIALARPRPSPAPTDEAPSTEDRS